MGKFTEHKYQFRFFRVCQRLVKLNEKLKYRYEIIQNI